MIKNKKILIFSPLKKKIFFYFCSFISIFSIVYFIWSEEVLSPIEKNLSHITKEDREILQTAFDYLIFWGEFGYTLFADKPLSLEFHPSLESFYAAWEKNKRCFSLKKYFLTKFYINNYCGILIGNIAELKRIMEENKDSFDKVFAYSISSQTVIEALEKGTGEIFDTILHHDALLGILLGYGKENAWNFYHRDLLKKQPEPDVSALAVLEKKLQAFHKPFLFWEICLRRSKMLLPQFAADPQLKETPLLRKKYKAQRKMIEKKYKGKDSLFVTLNQLCN